MLRERGRESEGSVSCGGSFEEEGLRAREGSETIRHECVPCAHRISTVLSDNAVSRLPAETARAALT